MPEVKEAHATQPSGNGDHTADVNVFKFTVVRKEFPVECQDTHGVVRKYTLREMTGAERDKWQNEMQGRFKLEGGVVAGLSSFENHQAALIARCLYDESGKSVPIPVIAQWPASAQTALFGKCVEMNALSPESQDALKKA